MVTGATRRALLAFACIALAAGAAQAQADYPSRPVRIIVQRPSPAAAPTSCARVLAQQLSQSIGQQVLRREPARRRPA